MEGWIKLHRKLLKSDMYQALNAGQRDVLIMCLLLANHEENEWEFEGRIYKAEPGQFITSLASLKKHCAKDVSTRNIRTALQKLEKWQFLTNKSTKTGRLITILNWDTYQSVNNETDKDTDKQVTKHRQRGDKEVTTNKNDKEGIKNDREYIREDFLLIFNRWLKYKKDKKQSYKNEDSIKAAYNKLYKLADGDPELADKIVEQSLANNWNGLFELKDENKKPKKFTEADFEDGTGKKINDE